MFQVQQPAPCSTQQYEDSAPSEQDCYIREPLEGYDNVLLNFISYNNSEVTLVEFEQVNGNNVPFTRIPAGIFSIFQKLQVLRIHGNIQSINSSVFTDAHHLIDLQISGQLERINRNDFHNRLTFLDLSNNKIKYIEDGAFSSYLLSGLWLKNNKLSVIHEHTFSGLPNLQLLDLSNNEIANIDRNAFTLPRLNILSLGGNKIKRFSSVYLVNAPLLNYIQVNDKLMHRTREFGVRVRVLRPTINSPAYIPHTYPSRCCIPPRPIYQPPRPIYQPPRPIYQPASQSPISTQISNFRPSLSPAIHKM